MYQTLLSEAYPGPGAYTLLVSKCSKCSKFTPGHMRFCVYLENYT
jgi:hypothetical protein